MKTTADFRLGESLYADNQYNVFRAKDFNSGNSYVLKFSADSHPNPFVEHQLRKEAEILDDIAHEQVIRFIGIIPHENSIALLYEDSNFQSLSSLDLAEGMDLELFLNFSLQIAEVVSFIHSKGYVHKNLNAQNFWYDSDKNTICLGGFSLASKLGREFHRADSRDISYANVNYVSPEMTGRTNKVLDYRADLYSVGILFYYLLTGRFPFQHNDHMEVIHSHLAMKATPPKKVRPDLPKVISDIVMKLMEKDPAQRYQSAQGLFSDLGKCKKQFFSETGIVDFLPGLNDNSFVFSIPDKLYGRNQNLDNLKESFDNFMRGERELLLVSGYSGVGKSRLINEIKNSNFRNLYFISGKFDQLGQRSPLKPVFAALSDLINQILSESDKELEVWKKRFTDNLGANAGLITAHIPKLEILIGPQPEVPELPPVESANRFRTTFNAFFRTFAENNKLLCLFLDDLQWMDSASREWIEDSILSSQLQQFFFVGAYRDNEVNAAHPLSLMLDKLTANGVNINNINLQPLSLADLHEIVADTLRLEQEDCFDLAKIIYEKTGGNPFFTRQCLFKLYDSSAIKFDHDSGSWTYDLAKVKQLEISDNVLDLLHQNIRALAPELQRILKIASCFGNTFEVVKFSKIVDFQLDDLLTHLSKIEELGFLKPIDEREKSEEKYFKFTHDRLQQAAYDLLNENESKTLRMQIGEALLKMEAEKPTGNDIYTITDHLNYALDLVLQREELPIQLIHLNLEASQKAQNSTAYAQALNYATTANSINDSLDSPIERELLNDLYLQSAECYHLNGKYVEAEKYYKLALENCVDPLKRALTFQSKIHYFTNRQLFHEAYQTGVQAVTELGVSVPKKFIPPLFAIDLLKYKWLSRGKEPADFLSLSPMKDERLQMAMLLMATFARAAFQIKPELCVALAVKMVNLSLKYGNSDGVYIGHIALGPIFQGAIMNQKKKGYDFGQLTLNLIEKYNASGYRAEVYFVVGYFAVPWFDSAEVMEEYWRKAYESALEVGDYFHASCACCATVQSLFMRGVEFDKILAVSSKYLPFLERINNQEVILSLQCMERVVKNLKGETESPISFFENEEEMEERLGQFSTRHFAHFYFINKMKALYLWGEYQQAYNVLKKSESFLPDSPGMLHTAEHFFYSGLIIAAVLPELSTLDRMKAKNQLSKIIAKFKGFSKNNELNFSHKYHLLEAEYSILNDDYEKAEVFFNKADTVARVNGYNDIVALANLRAFILFQNRGRQKLAAIHLKDAYFHFIKIGATGIAESLREKYENSVFGVFTSSDFTNIASTKKSDSVHISMDKMDLTSILKSAEAISSKIKLTDLIGSLLQIIIENAGGERVVLLLKRGGTLKAVVEKFAHEEEVRSLDNQEYENYKNIPHSVINYVSRSNDSVVLDHASDNESFNQDPYFKDHQIKSVLCVPLLLKGQITGIIYLENNLSETVFNQERVELLKLLSGQMAISLENSQLYENLEEKVEERTRELLVEKKKSDDLLMNILPAETAEELKKTGSARAREFDVATILFTDFIDFTKVSETLDAQQLVNEINYFYSEFDRIIQKYGIEKIKTIGDSYMCAGGLPVRNLANPVDTVMAAMEIRDFVQREIEIRKREGRVYFEIRIGINTGPVIAGIVGIKKFAYDIWGDAVNVAARMESNGSAGKINISQTTYEAVKNHFVCRYRGKIDAKNKGKIDMYFVEGKIDKTTN